MRTLHAIAAAGCLAALTLSTAVAAAQAPQAGEQLALDSAEAKQIDAFLGTFQRAVQDGKGVVPFFDADALLTEAGKMGGAALKPVLENPQFRVGVRQGLQRNFGPAGAAQWAWKRHVLRRVIKQGPDRFVIVFRVWLADDTAEGRRWWLRPAGPESGGYQVVDAEAIELGVRMSAGMAAATLMMVTRNNQQAQAALGNINAAMKLLRAGQLEAAAQRCEAITAGVLPPAFEGLRLMILASQAGTQQEPEQMLRYIEQARRMEADTPILHFLEASAYVGLDRPVEGEAAGRRYLAEVGADPDGFWVVGRALTEQGKLEQAAAMYVRGLDEDASSLDCFAELVALWPDGDPRFAARMEQMPNALTAFDTMASVALNEERYGSLEQLCTGYAKVAPADPNVVYYRAQVVMHRDGDPAAAAKLLDGVMDRAPEEERAAYLREYCGAMLLAGKPLEAYARATAKGFAFETLAWELEGELLAKLVEAHRPNGAQDPWLHYFDAEVQVAKKQYDAAEKLYVQASGLTTDEEVLEEIRSARVHALFVAGKWRDAHSRCRPADATFRQLARLLNQQGDGAAVVALCDLHLKADPEEPMIAVWRAEGLALQGKHAEAVELAGRSLNSDDEALFNNAARRCVKSNIALKKFDEAQRVAKLSTQADGDPWWELVVAAARGDAVEAGRLMEHMVRNGTDPDLFWHDDLVTKALKENPAFAELAKKYPHQEH